MAPTPLEQSLSTLLPTIAFLPPELIHLATSLLAQSRSKAATLKPEEEIGRSYACAHIACERLTRQLDLEVGMGKPPVKPRVYAKLKGYLEGVLTARGTPQRATEREMIKTPTVRTPTSGMKRALPTEPTTATEEVPDFVMPLIRAICKTCSKPAAVPHINVGAMAVVREIVSRNVSRAQNGGGESSAKRRKRTPQSAKRLEETAPVEAITPAKWPALLVALFVFTAAKMDGSSEAVMRDKATGAVKAFCEDGRRVLPEELRALEGLEGSIKFYMLEAEDCGWLEMEWFGNVPEREVEEEEGTVESEDEGPVTPRRRPAKTPLRRKDKRDGGKVVEGMEVGAAGLMAGLGTMFQPAVDWLSDERRAEYTQWKKEIMREILAVEQKA